MGLGFPNLGTIERQVYLTEKIEEEKSRFKNPEVAKRYLRLYNLSNKILAEIGMGKNSPRYHAAKKILERGKNLWDLAFN